jgi:2-(1,2-epoxy-1,2-dihydrophenyl)acetyl-CoA isomerase
LRRYTLLGMLDYSAADGVAVITLNRPDVLNALDQELGVALLKAVTRAASDDHIRCIVLTGAGRAFCSGEDLGALGRHYGQGRVPDLGAIVAERYNPLIRQLRGAPKPVVAAVNGVAAGAGASIVLACDFRPAVDRARLILPFVNVGLIPDSGATWLLPRMVGTATAWELVSTGRAVGAEEARRLGLFTEVTSADGFEESWRSLADELAAGPTRAFALTKALLLGAGERSLDEHLEAEARSQAEAGATDDHLEGVRAFLAKRPPAFKGR